MSEAMKTATPSVEELALLERKGYRVQASAARRWYLFIRAVRVGNGKHALFKFPRGNESWRRLAAEATLLARFPCEFAPVLREVIAEQCTIWEGGEGAELGERIDREPLPLAEAVRLALDLARALEYWHARGVVHRDVNPRNVFVSPDGAAFLLDHGLARWQGAPQEPEAAFHRDAVRTHVAPECYPGRDRFTPAMDVFALGGVLRDCLLGAEQGATTWPKWDLAAVPSWLQDACLRCLAREPAERPAAVELIVLLLQGAGQRPEPFPYERLLDYYRQRLGPIERAEIEDLIRTNPRWKVHHESLAQLDFERMGAEKDGEELRAFDASRAAPLCQAVARSGGEVLRDLLKPGAERSSQQRQLQDHVEQCVYCRRTLRQMQADVVVEHNKLPAGEKLLREWLLEGHYREPLDRVTAALRRSVPVPSPVPTLRVRPSEQQLADLIPSLQERAAAMVRRHSLDEASAQDVVQETLLRVIVNLDRFDPAKGTFEAWASTILRLVASEHSRKAGRHYQGEVLEDVQDTGAERFSEVIDAKELMSHVVGELPSVDREILRLQLEGVTVREISERLGRSESFVSHELSRLLERLRARLGKG